MVNPYREARHGTRVEVPLHRQERHAWDGHHGLLASRFLKAATSLSLYGVLKILFANGWLRPRSLSRTRYTPPVLKS